jgi:hypothetical protein
MVHEVAERGAKTLDEFIRRSRDEVRGHLERKGNLRTLRRLDEKAERAAPLSVVIDSKPYENIS